MDKGSAVPEKISTMCKSVFVIFLWQKYS